MKTKVLFQNSRKNRLVGILSEPIGIKKKPLIILSHGLSTSKDGRTYLRLEKDLNKGGFSTFRFDFFGHGESEGLFEELTILEAVDDIIQAKNTIAEQGYKRLGLFGSSFGGMASLIAASQSDDYEILVLKSPVSDYIELLKNRYKSERILLWKEQGFIMETHPEGYLVKLNYTFYQAMKNADVYSAIDKIKCKTLIIHGDKDETVPLDQSKKTAHLIRNCRLEIIKGGDHTYSNPQDFEKMISLATSFFLDNL
jgi:pimeloyl-ACP methyl ester carboxylesterase